MRFLPLLLVAACAAPTSQFSTSLAPGYRPAPIRASLLGVYREGRVDVEGLRPLGPELTQAMFHDDACPLAIDGELRALKQTTFDALDDATKATGVSEPLLGLLSPAAEGDAIVFLDISGKVRNEPKAPAQPNAQPSPSTMGMGRGGGRRSGMSSGGRMAPRGPADENVLSLTATVYSIPEKRVVAVVDEEYTGTSQAEALVAFRNKVAATFPNSHCAGWKAEAFPTEDAIRRLPTE